MILLLYSVTDPKTTVSLIAGGKVWSPASKAWQPSAVDALVTPAFYNDPNHLGLAEVTFTGVVDPGAPVAAVLHDGEGKPVGQPIRLDALATTNAILPGAVNLGR